MTETNVSRLKINVLSQEQYDRIKQAGTINENELYMTPASGQGGGTAINPVAKDSTMTQAVGVDGSGLLWTAPNSGGSSNNYLPLAGGTMSGAITFASNSRNSIGTDSGIGHINSAGAFGVQGLNGETSIALLQQGATWGSSANMAKISYNGSRVNCNKPFYGAVWNDYAEYRKADSIEPGRCVIENGDDSLSLSTARMLPGAEIISDTFGFAIGETEECKTPIAAAGRVLAYPYEERNLFKPGMPVCSGPNGAVSIMSEDEARNYPWCIIGTVSAVPDYEEWSEGKVKVNGRVWIRIR